MDLDQLVRDAVAAIVHQFSDSADNQSADNQIGQKVLDLLGTRLKSAAGDDTALRDLLDAPEDQDSQRALGARLHKQLAADPSLVEALSHVLAEVQPASSTVRTTVSVGGNLTTKGIANFGGGSVTVNRNRNIRLGIGWGAAAIVLLGGATAGTVYLSQGNSSPSTILDLPVTTTSVPYGYGLPAPKAESNVLPKSPNDAVSALYMFVAEDSGQPGDNTAAFACFLFDDRTAMTFARAFGTSTCKNAMIEIRQQITDAYAYSSTDLRALPAATATQRTVTISSCEFAVTGGPRLGTFTLTKLPDGGWQITGYAPQQKGC